MENKKTQDPVILDAHWCTDGVWRVPDLPLYQEVHRWKVTYEFPDSEEYIAVDLNELGRNFIKNWEKDIWNQIVNVGRGQSSTSDGGKDEPGI